MGLMYESEMRWHTGSHQEFSITTSPSNLAVDDNPLLFYTPMKNTHFVLSELFHDSEINQCRILKDAYLSAYLLLFINVWVGELKKKFLPVLQYLSREKSYPLSHPEHSPFFVSQPTSLQFLGQDWLQLVPYVPGLHSRYLQMNLVN